MEVLCQQALAVLQLVGIRNTASTVATKVSPHAKEEAHKTLAFFTAVIVELAAKSSLDESVIRSIYLYLIEGLKTPFSALWSEEQTTLLMDWKNSALMITTQMSHKTNFGESLSKALTNSLSQSVVEGLKSPEDYSEYGQEMASTSLMVFIVLSQQGQSKVSHKALLLLYCNNESAKWLHEHLLGQKEQGVDVRPLCELIAAALLRGLSTSDNPAAEEHSSLSLDVQSGEIVFLIQSMLLSGTFVLDMLLKVLHGVSSFSSQTLDHLKAVIRCASHHMPSVFDAALVEVFKKRAIGNESLDKISAFLSEAFSKDTHHMIDFAGDSLFMALSSPIKVLRIQALQKIGSMTSFPQEELPDLVGLAEGVTRCMLENDFEISSVAFSSHTVQFALTYLPSESVYKTLAACWAWWVQFTCSFNAEKGMEMLRRILNSLCASEVLEKLLDNALDRICWIQTIAMAVVYSNDTLFEALYPVLSTLVQTFSHCSPKYALYVIDNRSKASRKITKVIEAKDEFKRHFVQGILSTLQTDPVGSTTWIDTVLSPTFNCHDLICFRELCCFGVCSVLLDVALVVEKAEVLNILIQRLLSMISSMLFDSSLSVQAKLVSSYLNCFKKVRKLISVGNDKSTNISQFLSPADNVRSDSLETACMQFLIKLLLSRNLALVQLFNKALYTFFPSTHLPVLFQMLAADSSLTHADYKLIFTASLEAWRLYGLHDLKEDMTSPEVGSWTLLSLGLVVHLGGHSDNEIRSAILETVDDVLKSLPSSGKVCISLPKSLPAELSLGELQLKDVLLFLSAVKERSSTISLQADGMSLIALEMLAEQQNSVLKAFWLLVTVLPSSHSYMRQAVTSLVADVEATQTWIVDFVKHILSNVLSGRHVDSLFISKMVGCLVKYFKANDKHRDNVLEYIVSILEMKMQTQAFFSTKDAFITALKIDLCPLLSSGAFGALFGKLLPIYVDDITHQSSLLELLTALAPPYSVVMGIIQEKTEQFLKLARTEDEVVMDTDTDDETKESSHQLQSSSVLSKLFLVLEASVPTFLRCQGIPLAAYSAMLHLLFSVLREIRLVKYKVMLSHEYIKMMIVEYIYRIFVQIEDRHLLEKFVSLLDENCTGGHPAQSAESTPAAKRKGRKPRSDSVGSVDAVDSVSYKKEDVVGDVILIMHCMGDFKQVQAHQHAFGILSVLLKLHHSAPEAAIEGLGQLLSSTHFGQHTSKERFLTGILEVLLPILAPQSADSNGKGIVICSGMQLIIQNLCSSLALMSKIHRKSLLKTTLKVLHNGGSHVFLVVHNLLLHTIANYERDFVGRSKNNDQVDTICISKASQRRAQRLLHTSVPEEFFQLSLSLLLQVPYVDRKLEVLIDFVNTASEIVHVSLNDLKKNEQGKALLDAEKSLSYLAKLSAPEKPDLSDGKEYAATLAILHIEYVLEVLENKEYHVQIAKYIADHPGSNKVQTCFLELADALLQLINYIDYRKRLPRSSSDNKSGFVLLRLEEEVYSISHIAYMEILSSRCMNVLQSLQLMFDAPTFISIFQELLEHEVLGVRQKVMLVLRERLSRLMQFERPNLAEVCLCFPMLVIFR